MEYKGLDVIGKMYPELRDNVEKLRQYIKGAGLTTGDLIDIQHAAASTMISEAQLRQIFDIGVELGLFTRMYRLQCSIHGGFICEQNEPFDLSHPIFCDLCGEEHEFTQYDVCEAYRIDVIL